MEMIYYNRFNINSERYRIPQYNISPFSTEWLKINYSVAEGEAPINYDLLSDFFGPDHYYFINGKTALFNALNQYDLNPHDEVYIVTTTGNKYISSCVTDEIEKKCGWKREISDKTKLIIVNHEFGMVNKNINEIKAFGLPIIEDMAMSMFSTDIDRGTGGYGDFTIFSLPKFFPVQSGGILRVNDRKKLSVPLSQTNEAFVEDLKRVSSHYLSDYDRNVASRKSNYKLFQEELGLIGIHQKFHLTDLEIPSVFMFSIPEGVNHQEFKVFMQSNGIEASIFYGEDEFFIPVHQNLDRIDIRYICSLIKYFCYAAK